MLQVILLLSIVLAVASAILLLWFVAFVVRHFPLWLEANAAGLGVSFIDLLTIHLRKLQPVELVDCLKVMRKAGVEVNRKMLSEMAIHDPDGFTRIVDMAKGALQ